MRAGISRHWLAGLTAVLGVLYILLGAAAGGLAGALGIAGGLLIVIVAAAARRLPPLAGAALLVLGAVPFPFLTWWSLVTPLIAVLALAIGGRVVAGGHRPAARPGRGTLPTSSPRPTGQG